jgi:hypothetical protein
VSLRFRPKPRDLYITRLTLVGRGQGLATGQKSVPLDFRFTLEHERWVERLLPNGNAVVQDRIRSGSLTFQGKTESLPATDRVSMEVSPLGKIARLDNLDLRLAQTRVGTNLSPAALAQFTLYPLKPLTVGKAWRAVLPIRIPKLGSAKASLKATLVGLRQAKGFRCAELASSIGLPFSLNLAEGPLRLQVKGQLQGQSRLLAAVDNGMPVSGAGTVKLSVNGFSSGRRDPKIPASGMLGLRIDFNLDLVSYVPGSPGVDRRLASAPTPLPLTPAGSQSAARKPGYTGPLGGLFGVKDLARQTKDLVEARQRQMGSLAGGAQPGPLPPMPPALGSPPQDTPETGVGPSAGSGAGAVTPAGEGTSGSQPPAEVPQESAPPPPPPDPVRLMSVEPGELLAGVKALRAEVASAEEVVFVAFVVDGRKLLLTNRMPYCFTWDTRGIGDGKHEVSAWLLGSGGKVLFRSPATSVEVGNEVLGPPSPSALEPEEPSTPPVRQGPIV